VQCVKSGTQQLRSRRALRIEAFEVKKQLTANWVDYGAMMAEGKACARSHRAGFDQRIGHTRHSPHGHHRVTNRGR
jgi:hypothetical protein